MTHALPTRSITSPRYLSRTPLEKALQARLTEIYQRYPNLQVVLDLGSGQRYYQQLFGDEVTYMAMDIGVEDSPDVAAIGEELPFRTGTIDLVICVQVLEHVYNPDKVVAEIARVLKPGGVVLLSTHGTMFYHPTPNDYWRWTKTGLEKLFRESGNFSAVEVTAAQGTFQTLGYLLAWYASTVGSKVESLAGPLRRGIRLFKEGAIALINYSAIFADYALPHLSRADQPGTLIGIYVVLAQTSGENLP